MWIIFHCFNIISNSPYKQIIDTMVVSIIYLTIPSEMLIHVNSQPLLWLPIHKSTFFFSDRQVGTEVRSAMDKISISIAHQRNETYLLYLKIQKAWSAGDTH